MSDAITHLSLPTDFDPLSIRELEGLSSFQREEKDCVFTHTPCPIVAVNCARMPFAQEAFTRSLTPSQKKSRHAFFKDAVLNNPHSSISFSVEEVAMLQRLLDHNKTLSVPLFVSSSVYEFIPDEKSACHYMKNGCSDYWRALFARDRDEMKDIRLSYVSRRAAVVFYNDAFKDKRFVIAPVLGFNPLDIRPDFAASLDVSFLFKRELAKLFHQRVFMASLSAEQKSLFRTYSAFNADIVPLAETPTFNRLRYLSHANPNAPHLWFAPVLEAVVGAQEVPTFAESSQATRRLIHKVMRAFCASDKHLLHLHDELNPETVEKVSVEARKNKLLPEGKWPSLPVFVMTNILLEKGVFDNDPLALRIAANMTHMAQESVTPEAWALAEEKISRWAKDIGVEKQKQLCGGGTVFGRPSRRAPLLTLVGKSPT